MVWPSSMESGIIMTGSARALLPLLCFTLIHCSPATDPGGDPVLTDLEFMSIETSDSDATRTLQSLKREGDHFLLTFYGDYRARLDSLNDRVVQYGIGSILPNGEYPSACSIFSGLGNTEQPFFGRNLDNSPDRAVLVGRYDPPDGYASIAVSNMVDMGFNRGDDPTQVPLEDRQLLLNAVIFPTDGINERGLSIALASVNAVQIVRSGERKSVCVSYLLREVLDQAATVEEAIAIIEDRDVFDMDINTLSHHFLVADAGGNSAIAEYRGGTWRIMRNERAWQVVTNSFLYNHTEEQRRNQCGRYRRADNYLSDRVGTVTWQEGMRTLELMSEPRTQWSAVYDLAERIMYISLYRRYGRTGVVRF
ncbi:linear amide C-N hydrolase [Gemmatimonadota bacterium]